MYVLPAVPPRAAAERKQEPRGAETQRVVSETSRVAAMAPRRLKFSV